ncbi:methionine--tRNA ligase [archaeon]|nr:methionine--tRNA ligase [archaeon]
MVFFTKSKFYITTAIDYVNGKPHIGHAYEKIIADVLARYNRLKGNDVFFLTGTDEHGEKIFRSAEKAGKDPQEFVDELSQSFRELCSVLSISNDDFIRTTDERHERIVQKILTRLYEKGDIYKGNYEGWYCVPCESYWTDTQLVEDNCPNCNRPVEKKKEEGYFFRLSKYEKPLLKLFKENKDFVYPPSRKKEVENRLKEGLNDLCITRKAFKWGTPFPIDNNYVTYVWVEALSNYITALDYPNKKFKKYWPADIHLVGKDINWFHSVIWPAILLSLEIKPPKMVGVHGFLTLDGEKMSKSKGNVVDPIEIANCYGADALRYYLISETAFGGDGVFSEQKVVKKLNNELADILGNFVHRTVILSKKFFEEQVPTPSNCTEIDRELIAAIKDAPLSIGKKYDELQLKQGLDETLELVTKGNAYLNAQEPWKNEEVRANTLYVCLNLCRNAAILLSPVIPTSSQKIWETIGEQGQVSSQNWENASTLALKPGHKLNTSKPLFKKVELKEQEESGGETMDNTITFDEFQKVDLRAALVKNVEDIEGADKLYKLTLDVGELGERTIAAGIKKYYKKEEIQGKTIGYVANLEPRTVFGVESCGMLLAAESGNNVCVVTFERDIKPGTQIS